MYKIITLILIIGSIICVKGSDTLSSRYSYYYTGKYNKILFEFIQWDQAGDSGLMNISGYTLDNKKYCSNKCIAAHKGETIKLNGIADFIVIKVTDFPQYTNYDFVVLDTYKWVDDSIPTYFNGKW